MNVQDTVWKAPLNETTHMAIYLGNTTLPWFFAISGETDVEMCKY